MTDGGAKRQLPSWMRRCTNDKASTSQSKEENGSLALDTKNWEPLKKCRQMQHDVGDASLIEKPPVLKKSAARGRKRKLIKPDEDQGQGPLLKKCDDASKRRRKSSKLDKDNGFDEEKVDEVVKRRRKDSAHKKKQKAKVLTEDPSDGVTESFQGEDELTMEDLLSIAQEYVNADKENQVLSDKKPLRTASSMLRSEKNLTSHVDGKLSVSDKPMSSDSSSTRTLPYEGSNISACSTGGPPRGMLDFLLGPLLRKAEEIEKKKAFLTEKLTCDYHMVPSEGMRKKTDDVSESVMINYKHSEGSQSNTEPNGVPLSKKRGSFRDQIAMLLN